MVLVSHCAVNLFLDYILLVQSNIELRTHLSYRTSCPKKIGNEVPFALALESLSYV